MTESAATKAGSGAPLNWVNAKVVSAITTPTWAVPVTPSTLAAIVVEPGPTAMRKPGAPTTLPGDPMTATSVSPDVNVAVRAVIDAVSLPHSTGGDLYTIAASEAHSSWSQLHPLNDEPADREIVASGGRAAAGGDAHRAGPQQRQTVRARKLWRALCR